MSYFASDSTRVNVYVVSIDYDDTFLFNFHPDSTVTIADKEYYVATANDDYLNDDLRRILLREETETGRLYRYDMVNEMEILVCDMSLEVSDIFHTHDGDGYPMDITVTEINYTESGRKQIIFDEYSIYDYIVFTEGYFPEWNPLGIPSIGYMQYQYNELLCEYFNGE